MTLENTNRTINRSKLSKKKGPRNVTIPEALFNVAILENHFHRPKSTIHKASFVWISRIVSKNKDLGWKKYVGYYPST